MTEPSPTVAIIGAGMSGLACAARLRAAGLAPVVFEKSRGLGGRMATRRAEGLAFDHGAQFVTAKGDAFREYLAAAGRDGFAGAWAAGHGYGWTVGVPGMNALVKPLAAGIDVRHSVEVARVQRDGDGGGWQVETVDGSLHGPYGAVVSTAPAPQARRVLAGVEGMDEALSAVRIAPCWALMAGLERRVGLPDAARHEAGPLAFVARNGSKPGRPGGEAFVVHASPDWSAAQLEIDRDEARERLLALFAEHAGGLPGVTYATAHRWRFAMTREPLGAPFAASADGSVLAGGDWALGARVEAAFDSGRAMAAAVLARQPS